MDCSEQRSHARVVYPTQDTSRMGTARVKEEEGAESRIIVKGQYEIWKEGTWAQSSKEKSSKQGQTNTMELTIELPEER